MKWKIIRTRKLGLFCHSFSLSMHGYIVVFIWNPFVPGIAERWIINIQDFYINAP